MSTSLPTWAWLCSYTDSVCPYNAALVLVDTACPQCGCELTRKWGITKGHLRPALNFDLLVLLQFNQSFLSLHIMSKDQQLIHCKSRRTDVRVIACYFKIQEDVQLSNYDVTSKVTVFISKTQCPLLASVILCCTTLISAPDSFSITAHPPSCFHATLYASRTSLVETLKRLKGLPHSPQNLNGIINEGMSRDRKQHKNEESQTLKHTVLGVGPLFNNSVIQFILHSLWPWAPLGLSWRAEWEKSSRFWPGFYSPRPIRVETPHTPLLCICVCMF